MVEGSVLPPLLPRRVGVSAGEFSCFIYTAPLTPVAIVYKVMTRSKPAHGEKDYRAIYQQRVSLEASGLWGVLKCVFTWCASSPTEWETVCVYAWGGETWGMYNGGAGGWGAPLEEQALWPEGCCVDGCVNAGHCLQVCEWGRMDGWWGEPGACVMSF